jgi:Cu/Ag efflux pump CusA
MVEHIIELSVRYKWVVFGAILALALFATDSVRKTPLGSTCSRTSRIRR